MSKFKLMRSAAFHCHEILTIQLEYSVLNRSFFVRLSFCITFNSFSRRVWKYGSVKIYSLFRSSKLITNKRQKGNNLLWTFGNHHLPGDSEPILEPSKFFSKWIFTQFHQNCGTVRKFLPKVINFTFSFVINKK